MLRTLTTAAAAATRAGSERHLQTAVRGRSGYGRQRLGVTADVSRSIGPASGRIRLQHSPDGAALTWALTRNIDVDLRYHDTDANVPGEQYVDALVAGISFAFLRGAPGLAFPVRRTIWRG
jgi:hypothetical protein